MIIRIALVLLFFGCLDLAAADTWYVNNLIGKDENDGLSERKAFRSFKKATEAMKTSDSLFIVNTGEVYRESLLLSGKGGTPSKPMVIEGNGAVISGLRKIDSARWQKKGDVYEIAGPQPYGWPMLIIDGQRSPAAVESKLQPGEWSWLRVKGDAKQGVLRFRPHAGKALADYQLEGSFEVSGLRVNSSSYLVIRNLITEFHSNDGFNIHGDCRSTAYENIVGRYNGDDGFSIHEAVEAVVRGGHFHHNGSGIEDVNLSRSFYSGIRVHDNSRLGILFIGAFHSAVDVHVYDNPSNFRITPGVTKHLLGGEFSPIQGTSVYLQNVISHGGKFGAWITDRARVMIVSSVFAGSKIGIAAEKGSRVHLTKSVVANCEELELRLKGESFFGEANIYFPGRYQVKERIFVEEEWDAFKAAVGHHEESLQQDPSLDSHFHIGEKSLQKIGNQRIGPTAFYEELDQ